MIYIELEENVYPKEEERFWKKVYYKFLFIKRSKFLYFEDENVEDKTLIKLYNLTNRSLNKLSQYMEKKCICNVCISDKLLENKNFMEFIRNENVRIFDSKWLFKILAIKVTEYIVENKNERIETQEISIVTNKIDDIIVYTIKNLAERVKSINIITPDSYKFRKLEKELYEEKGIIVNMNNNYKKSLLKSDIILNFDYSDIEFNKYYLPKKACIVNFNKDMKIYSKSFEGININSFEIAMPKEYLNFVKIFGKFNISNIYESFIFKNTNPRNIINKILKDNVEISFLIGKNGKIKKSEFVKMSKKLAN